MAEVKVAVKQDPNDVVVADVLATAIRDISQTVRRWNSAGMKKRALICLLNDLSKVGKRDIEFVLNSMDSLEQEYCIARELKKK
jgi:hypothetical protein